VVLAIATVLHPLTANPDDAPAAFAEYSLDNFWIATHLGQLAGLVLIGGGLFALSWRLRKERAAIWGALGAIGAVISLAIAGALQAVDGIALKAMVDRLAHASPEAWPAVFEAAFAVRQLEIGLASIMAIFLGLAVIFYGMAQLADAKSSNWIAGLGFVSGAATLAAGVVQAYMGFADATMAVSMPGSILLLLWTVAVGWNLIRGSDKKGNPA
jgi:hypothetical protein